MKFSDSFSLTFDGRTNSPEVAINCGFDVVNVKTFIFVASKIYVVGVVPDKFISNIIIPAAFFAISVLYWLEKLAGAAV